MTDTTTISLREDTKERLQAAKFGDETWDEFLDRLLEGRADPPDVDFESATDAINPGEIAEMREEVEEVRRSVQDEIEEGIERLRYEVDELPRQTANLFETEFEDVLR